MTGAHTMAISAAVEGTFRLGDVFSKAFHVFGRHIVAFFFIAVLANLPAYSVRFIVAQLATPNPGFVPGLGGLLVTYSSAPVTMICWAIANGAMTYGVVQDLRGRTMSIAQASVIAVRRFLPLIGVAIVAGLLFWLGFVLLIVPGLIVYCLYYVAAPACIAEQAGVGASLSRSRFLTKGHRLQIFGAAALIWIVWVIVSLAITSAVIALSGQVTTALRAIQIVSFGVQALLGAFNAVLVGVFYYQLRVAKDGVDIDKIASVFE
jgi:uncharacterized membrane protein